MAAKYTSKLSTIESGQVITVFGRTRKNAGRLDIELTEVADECQSGDIPLHISIRFDPVDLVRNSQTAKIGWGVEERKENLISGNVLNPIKPGEDFKVSIFISHEMYYISINDKPYCTYKHRRDFKQIKRLNINKDVEQVYEVQHSTGEGKKWPTQVDSLYRVSIPKAVKPGDIFVISGTTRGSNSGTFALNFFDEHLKRPYFHMRAQLGKKGIGLNSQNENHFWQQHIETAHQPYPFETNKRFKMAIVVKDNCFAFYANGRIVNSLPFRETPARIFSSMNGIEIFARDGVSVEVHSFDHVERDCKCSDFDSFIAKITA